MISPEKENHLIQAKLYRPELSRDYVRRTRLLDRLESGTHRPLFLISAPAGYGKSTLAASIAEESNYPTAWLSLSKDDNQLYQFLGYLGAAIQTVFPGSMRVTSSMISASEMLSMHDIIPFVSNELSQIERPFFIVLDDYHNIQEASIHEVLTGLLRQPPKPMHLVLSTRRDPPLPLDSLRARGLLLEFRLRELRFTREETSLFLHKNGMRIENSMIDFIDRKTEGWAAGLRLLTLSADTEEPELQELQPNSRFTREYLIKEVISHQPEVVQDFLITTAFLPSFCASLCESVVSTSTKEMGGHNFIKWLEKTNLFIVPLDQGHRWFRLHHLFQEVLRDLGESRYGKDGVAAIHARACDWFDENGYYEEAVQQALSEGNGKRAIEVFIKRRHNLMNQESWPALERLLLSLPKHEQMNQIELLVQKAWCLENRFRIEEFQRLVNHIKNISSSDDAGSALSENLVGEILALESANSYYLFKSQEAANAASKALENIPIEYASVRAFAVIVLSMARQMNGDFKHAIQLLQRSLARDHLDQPAFRGRIYTAMSFLYWLQADLFRLRPCATQQIKFGADSHLIETESFAHYFLGVCHYYMNDLDSAKMHLTSAMELSSATHPGNYFHSAFALTLAYQAEGNIQAVSELENTITSRAFDIGTTELLCLAEAFRVELRLRQGSSEGAGHWIQSYQGPSFKLMLRFYVPDLTYCRALINQGGNENLKRAENRLKELKEFVEKTNNRRVLIDVHLLRALVHLSKDKEERALVDLDKGVRLAEKGGFVRCFLDLGKPIADLLVLLARDGVHVSFIGKLLRAFRKEASRTVASEMEYPVSEPLLSSEILVEPLSNRELEMLNLVSRGLRNKEIAEKLFVSQDTVKKHLYNSYQKLGVKNRRGAVARVNELGLLHKEYSY